MVGHAGSSGPPTADDPLEHRLSHAERRVQEAMAGLAQVHSERDAQEQRILEEHRAFTQHRLPFAQRADVSSSSWAAQGRY